MLLLADPVVADLNSLPLAQRNQFLQDMTIVGNALLQVTGATRINYEILGKREAALHAHLFPRYATEPEDHRHKPVWFYDREHVPQFDLAKDRELMNEIAQAIAQLHPSSPYNSSNQ